MKQKLDYNRSQWEVLDSFFSEKIIIVNIEMASNDRKRRGADFY